MFGLDLVLTPDGRLLLVEVNPRIQSVTSLLNYREREAGLMPLPGVHLLAGLSAPVEQTDADLRADGLSQVVVTARRDMTIDKPQPSGRYAWDGDRLCHLSPSCAGPSPAASEILVWPYAKAGNTVWTGDRLFYLGDRPEARWVAQALSAEGVNAGLLLGDTDGFNRHWAGDWNVALARAGVPLPSRSQVEHDRVILGPAVHVPVDLHWTDRDVDETCAALVKRY